MHQGKLPSAGEELRGAVCEHRDQVGLELDSCTCRTPRPCVTFLHYVLGSDLSGSWDRSLHAVHFCLRRVVCHKRGRRACERSVNASTPQLLVVNRTYMVHTRRFVLPLLIQRERPPTGRSRPNTEPGVTTMVTPPKPALIKECRLHMQHLILIRS